MQGVLGGNKHGLFATLAADFSPEASAACMARLAKMAARTMGNQGFSIGIDDVTPKEKLAAAKSATVNKGYTDVQQYIQAYRKVSMWQVKLVWLIVISVLGSVNFGWCSVVEPGSL